MDTLESYLAPLTSDSHHSLVIGPMRVSPLFDKPARSYYCRSCGCSFLVCNNSVVAFDENGKPSVIKKSSDGIDAFAAGYCRQGQLFAPRRSLGS
jgi:hypothetical protein